MVDFPEPESPMMTNISPSSMARLASLTPSDSPFFQYLRFVESFLNIFESTVWMLAKYLIKIFDF